MNIAVIAANGRLGKAFIAEALAAGHSVRAGVRRANSLAPTAGVTIVTCDATNPDDLRNLIQNQDVVVSAIGHVKGSKTDVQAVATKALISVMDTLQMKRFITVTGTGVRIPGDTITLIDRFLNFGVGLADPSRVADGIEQAKLLESSDLDWTLLRVLKLQNVADHPFTLTLHGPTKVYVGRVEVAKAMLQVIENGTFIREAPIVSKQ